MSDKELMPCPFCSAVLSKNSENDSASFCGNVNCPFSGIEIPDDWWNSAYCWKEIARLKAEVRRSQELIDRLDAGLSDERAANAKQRDLIKRLVEALRSALIEVREGGHASDIEGIAARCPNCYLCIVEEALYSAQQFLESETPAIPVDGTGTGNPGK